MANGYFNPKTATVSEINGRIEAMMRHKAHLKMAIGGTMSLHSIEVQLMDVDHEVRRLTQEIDERMEKQEKFHDEW